MWPEREYADLRSHTHAEIVPVECMACTYDGSGGPSRSNDVDEG